MAGLRGVVMCAASLLSLTSPDYAVLALAVLVLVVVVMLTRSP